MSMRELKLLKAFLPTLEGDCAIPVGPGDDCAGVLPTPGKMLLCAADQVIEKVHFLPDTPPEAAGAKLMNRNLSDIAAMGGVPRWALLTLAGNGHSEAWNLAFLRGAADAGKPSHTRVVGGDLAGLPAPGVVATLTILGEVDPDCAVRRSGAKVGDRLFVTGRLGGSFPSGRHLHFTPRLAEGRFLGEGRFASAMLDVSDGLLLDASRLASASRIGLRLRLDQIPVNPDSDLAGALGDGEDYELLFTVPAERVAELRRSWPEKFALLTEIGEAVSGAGVWDEQGMDLLKHRRIGYEH